MCQRGEPIPLWRNLCLCPPLANAVSVYYTRSKETPMGTPTNLYRPSLALLTDLYQLTMAYAAWRSGNADREAVFHLFFRKTPFGGGFALVCGLEYVKDY